MAYSSPTSFVSGNTLTAADLNIHVNDIIWLKAALAVIGQTSDTVLGPVIGKHVGVRATRTSAQSIANATDVSIQLTGTEDYDTDGFHSTSVSTQRLTVPAGMGGYYLISGGVRWASDNVGRRSVYIEKNGISGGGTSYIDSFQEAEIDDTSTFEMSTGSIVLALSAGDYVALTVRQTSGGNLDVSLAAFWMARIGAT